MTASLTVAWKKRPAVTLMLLNPIKPEPCRIHAICRFSPPVARDDIYWEQMLQRSCTSEPCDRMYWQGSSNNLSFDFRTFLISCHTATQNLMKKKRGQFQMTKSDSCNLCRLIYSEMFQIQIYLLWSITYSIRCQKTFPGVKNFNFWMPF